MGSSDPDSAIHDPRHAAQRLQGLIDAALDCIVSVDQHGMIIEFNRAAERVFGYQAAVVLGQPMADLIIPPDYRQRHQAGMQRHLESGELNAMGRRMELEAMRADGSRFPCELTLLRQDLDGHPIFTAFMRDITERKLDEKRLSRLNDHLEEQVASRTQELLRTIASLQQTRYQLERAQEIALVGDSVHFPQTGLRIWSRETFRLYGMPFTEHAPSTQQILGVIHSKDYLAKRDQIERTLASLNPERELEYRVTRPDGSVRWLRTVSLLEQSETSGNDCVVSTIQDITEQKAAESEMLKAIEKERELGKLKSDFLHMITHEYRTPLGIINSAADILKRYHERLTDDERRSHLDDIKLSARRLADLVEEVLFIGKSDSEAVTLNLRNVNYRAIVEEIAAAVVTQYGFPREIVVEESPLPRDCQSDEQLLRHILGNVIGNALKYSTLDKPVHIRLSATSEAVTILVIDQGIGIPETDQAKIFSMFHRGANVGTISGTGLGLVIAKRCVALLGGSITLRSAVGVGTGISICLPCYPAPNARV